MAIAEIPQGGPLALPGGAVRHDAEAALGVFSRPRVGHGWKSWVFGVDHKKVGIMYGAAALLFFVIGGAEALLIRLQLAQPEGKLISADLYNQAFTNLDFGYGIAIGLILGATVMVFGFLQRRITRGAVD